MTFELFTLFSIGLLLGLRHAMEPDHVIAVSTIASRTGNLLKAAAAGIFWGLGHTLTLFVVGLLFIGLKMTIPEKLALSMEMLVGIMIVGLGIFTVRSFYRKKVHVHVHEHDGEKHAHFHSHQDSRIHQHSHIHKPKQKSFFIGVVHGLAGSGAMVILTMGTAKTFLQSAFYILFFGAGTVLGMLIFAVLLGIPFVFLARFANGMERKLGLAAGILSIGYGLFFMYQIAFTEGLLF